MEIQGTFLENGSCEFLRMQCTKARNASCIYTALGGQPINIYIMQFMRIYKVYISTWKHGVEGIAGAHFP